MAVVNSEREAENLRHLYLNYGPAKIQGDLREEEMGWTFDTTQEPTPTPAPDNAVVHIGFHDLFIEGEYLSIRSK
jgi:hypothetical protein